MRDRLVLVPHGDRSAPVPDHPAPRARLAVVLVAGLAALGSAGAPDLQVNPRAIVVLPFDASSLSPGDQWMSEAIAQAISLGLVQRPGLVQIERDRLSAVVDPAVWREMHVSQAGQAVHADAALYGRSAGKTRTSCSSLACWTSRAGRRRRCRQRDSPTRSS